MTLAQEFAALNEATRRAHEAIADMRAERRLLADERKAAEVIRGEITQLINDQCSAAIGECVDEQLQQFVPAMVTQMDKSKASIEATFDELKNLYLGMGSPNTEPIEDLVIDKIARTIVLRRGL